MKPSIDTMVGVGTNSGYGTRGANTNNSLVPQYSITTRRGSTIPYASRITFDDEKPASDQNSTSGTITIGDPHSSVYGTCFGHVFTWTTETSGNKYLFLKTESGALKVDGAFANTAIDFTDHFIISFMVDNTEYYAASLREGDDDNSMNSVAGAITMEPTTRNSSTGISTTSFHYYMVDHGPSSEQISGRWPGNVKPQDGEFGFWGSNQGLPGNYNGSETAGRLAGMFFNEMDLYGNNINAYLTQIINTTSGKDGFDGVSSKPQIWVKMTKVSTLGDEDYDDVMLEVMPQTNTDSNGDTFLDTMGYFGGTPISPTTDNKYFPTKTNTYGNNNNNAIPNIGTIWFQTNSKYTDFMNKTVAGHDATGLTATEMSVYGTESDGTTNSYTPNFGGITEIIIAYAFSDEGGATSDYNIANRVTSLFNSTAGCTIRLERTSEDGATFSSDGSGRFGLYRITALNLTWPHSPCPYVTYTVENITHNSSKDFVVDEPVKVSFCEYESTVQFRCYNNSGEDGTFRLGGHRIDIDEDDVFYSHPLKFTNQVRNLIDYQCSDKHYYAKIDTPKYGLLVDLDIMNYSSGTTWEDLSGLGNDFTIGSDVSVTGAGTDTGYFTLDGSADSVIYGSKDIMPVGHNDSSFGSSPEETRNRLDAYTMFIVFKMNTEPATTDGSDVQQLISAGGPTGSPYQPWVSGFPWGIHIGKSGTTIAAAWGGYDGTVSWGSGITVGTTSWMCLSVTYSGRSSQPWVQPISNNLYKGYKLAADLRQPGTGNASASHMYKPIVNTAANTKLSIGAYRVTSHPTPGTLWTNYFKGRVSVVKVYDYPLSETELTTLYNAYKDRYSL